TQSIMGAMPTVESVRPRVPPSRYRLTATTSLAALRRRMTRTPETSELVVNVSGGGTCGRGAAAAAWGAQPAVSVTASAIATRRGIMAAAKYAPAFPGEGDRRP